MVPNPHHITQNLSHSNKDLVYSFARSLKGKHPLCSEQKCTFSHACMHACKYCTFMHVYIIKKKYIYIYIYTLTQRPFISLFISIISHNYNSVLSGSSELESKCLVLARSYISHSRTGGGEWEMEGSWIMPLAIGATRTRLIPSHKHQALFLINFTYIIQ